MKYTPHNYQTRAENWILDHKQCALFLDMGLGKTIITLTAVQRLIQSGDIHKALVIAPKTVAESTWTTEAAKWDHLKHLRVSKCTGTATERKRHLESDADVYIIGRDNVVWLTDNFTWQWDCLILDELSSFKNPQAKRFRALKKIRNKCTRIIGLTGTPASNSLMDLWAEMYLIDGGERLCKTLTGYRCLYFRPGAGRGHVVYEWIPLPDSQKLIEDKLSDICLSMSASDYLTLPPALYNRVYVEMTKREKQKYTDMKKDHILELKDSAITAAGAAAAMGKLLQMANGRVYDEDGNVQEIHRHKLDALKDIIDTADGPVLVFYDFRHDLDAIRAEFPKARLLQSEQDINDWNAGKISILLAHPASCSKGLNLQAGGRIVVWYGLTWSLENYLQANARLYRQGQDKPVIIHHIITKDTVDEKVMQALENKEMTQTALLNALKAA